MKNKMLRNVLSIIFIFCMISSNVFATSVKEITKEMISKEKNPQVESEIYEDGSKYLFSYLEQVDKKVDKKQETYTTEPKEFNTSDEEILRKEFGNAYLFENNDFQGELPLKDFTITTMDNGFEERIDTQKIPFEHYKVNDLNDIEKEKTINNQIYVLINVNWIPDEVEIIDGQEVPMAYKGEMIYQRVVREKNPTTYMVSANYEGEVTEKNPSIVYKLHYEEEVQNTSMPIIVPILIALGFLVIGIFLFLLRPNVKIYNIQKEKLVKIKTARAKDKKMISLKTDKINGNQFLLVVNKSSLSKLLKKQIIIKLNEQRKAVTILSQNNHFSM